MDGDAAVASDIAVRYRPKDFPAGGRAQATPPPIPQPTQTPTEFPRELLEQQGSNRGIIGGAAILVLIVIGGVAWASWRRR